MSFLASLSLSHRFTSRQDICCCTALGVYRGERGMNEQRDRVSIIAGLDQKSITVLDDELPVVLASDGELYMSVPSICVALGINIRAQLRRILRTSALAPSLRQLAVQTPGGLQWCNCLSLNGIPVWLAGIRLDLTQNQPQQKLDVYRQELERQASITFPRPPMPLTNSSQVPEPLISHVREDSAPAAKQQVEDRPHMSQVSLVHASSEDVPSHNANADEDWPTFSKKGTPHKRQRAQDQMLRATIPPHDLYSHLVVTACEEDTAFRESCLAKEQRWTIEEVPYYAASNQVQIFLDHPELRIDPAKARQRIRSLAVSTVSTGRIAMGLWYNRWKDGRLSENGNAAIGVREILMWRDIQKRSRAVSPGSSTKISIDYESKFLERVCQDFNSLRQCHLRRQYNVAVNGKLRQFSITSPYMYIGVVTEENIPPYNHKVSGFLVKPGDWFATYLGHGLDKFAVIDRRIFSLDPQHDSLAACIAFYLVERWQALAREASIEEIENDLLQPFRAPIRMSDLLTASMIGIDRINLTSRLVGRVEAALAKLFVRHILGDQPLCLSSIKTNGYWGRAWLSSLWNLVPTLEVADEYQQAIRRGHF